MDSVILLGQLLEATSQYRQKVWLGEFAVEKDLRFVVGQSSQFFVKTFHVISHLPLLNFKLNAKVVSCDALMLTNTSVSLFQKGRGKIHEPQEQQVAVFSSKRGLKRVE